MCHHARSSHDSYDLLKLKILILFHSTCFKLLIDNIFLWLTPHHGPVSHTERDDPALDTERDDPPAMDTERAIDDPAHDTWRADDDFAKNTERASAKNRDDCTKEFQDCVGNSIYSTTGIGSSKHARKCNRSLVPLKLIQEIPPLLH